MTSRQSSAVAAVLLAAGESSRMGRLKGLLEWRGVPLLQYQIAQLCAARVGQVVVVVGHDAERLRPLVEQAGKPPRVRVAVNPDWRQGKTTSIKTGLRALSGQPRAVMLLAADQPRTSDILERLIQAHLKGRHLISVPSCNGKHGHPPLFDGSLVSELLRITEEGQGIREVINRHRQALRDVPMETPLVLTNLNTEEDYRRAKERWG